MIFFINGLKLADKSHLLQTVNRTQEQLESVEEECERIIRKRKSVSKRLSTEPVELKQNSVKLNKLLHEIEGIKTAISVVKIDIIVNLYILEK